MKIKFNKEDWVGINIDVTYGKEYRIFRVDDDDDWVFKDDEEEERLCSELLYWVDSKKLCDKYLVKELSAEEFFEEFFGYDPKDNGRLSITDFDCIDFAEEFVNKLRYS